MTKPNTTKVVSNMGLDLNSGNPAVANRGEGSNVLDFAVPQEMNEIVDTGNPHINALFAGDGIVPGSVVMFTGSPGTGKTTLTLQLADSCTGMGHLVVLTGLEENLYQTRRTCTRLGLKNGFIPDYTSDVDELIARYETLAAMKENKGKRIIAIIDSLPCLTIAHKGKGRPMTGDKMVEEALKRLVAWAKRTWSVVIVINHVTKGGKFAGKNLIKHMVDCHLSAVWDKDRKSDTYKQRILEQEKNRFGVAGIYMPFKLGPKGLVFEGADGYEDLPDPTK